MAEPQTLKLGKPIKAHGQDVSELSFREPTAKDIRAAGMPYATELRAGGARRLVVDADAVALLIAACCAIPPSSVDLLGAADFADAQGIIMGFFGDSSPQS